jgi:hypothetical protein
MSLFRTAIVLSLGVALMPSDRAQQEQLYERAAAAAHWTATFCDRNGQTCENAALAWDVFVAKAQFAGQLAYDVAHRYMAEEAGGIVAPASYSPKAHGTLKPDDLRPDWRGDGSPDGA